MNFDKERVLKAIACCPLLPPPGDTVALELAQDWLELTEQSAGIRTLMYELARHIRNTGKLPPTKWGVEGGTLLAKVRKLDSEQYDKLVK